MQLPPKQANEPEWLSVQRRVRKEERSWSSGAWTATVTFMLPYALIDALLRPANTIEVFLAASVAFLVSAIVLLRRALKGTFKRGFAIWSVPLHGAAVVAFGAALLR